MKRERPAFPAALIAASLLCLAAARCATAPRTEASDPEAGKQALVAADEAFSRMAQERGLAEAFAAFAAPDATMMPVNHGKYCSVWKKQPDGSWKWVVDIGNSSPGPPADRTT